MIVFHPALLRAVIAGPADMFLAAFLLMFCLALYNLRARSGTSEVMGVGLALMALAFSHPMGAAFAFAAVPFLAFAVRPMLVANSALNVVVALIFPTVFAVAAFSYVSWIFPGDGWTFFAAPTESLSLWTAAVSHVFGDGLGNFLALDASSGDGGGARRRRARRRGDARTGLSAAAACWFRPRCLSPPAIAATAISIVSGFFGDPAAIVVAAPVSGGGRRDPRAGRARTARSRTAHCCCSDGSAGSSASHWSIR